MNELTSMNDVYSDLRLLLEDSVKRNMADGILLSGGLDTSILAAIASRYAPLKAFTVALEKSPAPDVEYAKMVASHLGLTHYTHIFTRSDLYDAIPAAIKAMKSFDPAEIRNDAAIYIGLKFARDNGVTVSMTGDGCDELFAGYSFLLGLTKERLDGELQKLWGTMKFSSIALAKELNVQVKLPYLDPEFKTYAMKIDSRLKVRCENGVPWGKWVLRKAFEDFLPKKIIWRMKTPIEAGSGTTVLPTMLNSSISNSEFTEKRQKYLDEDKVRIRDKEQLFYYEIYRSTVGVPKQELKEGRSCPFCNSSVPIKASHCRTCGAYPI